MSANAAEMTPPNLDVASCCFSCGASEWASVEGVMMRCRRFNCDGLMPAHYCDAYDSGWSDAKAARKEGAQ